MENQRQKTASDRLFQAIGDEIVNGRLKSGQKLSEPKLARIFGTSRAPVREAIRRLEERGLIIRKPHLGPRVASFSVEKYIEIFEIREVLEGCACRLAAGKMTDAEMAQIRNIIKDHEREMLSHPKGSYAYQLRDFDFHFQIAKGSKNSFLIHLLCEEYYNLLRIHRNLHSWVPGRGEQALIDHLRILEAMEERDGELAEIMMRRHIKAAKTQAAQVYEKLLAEGKLETD